MFLWLTLLTGLLYPLLITLIALTMKQKAEGNFVFTEGRRVGAELIGQKFESAKYFWSRPSAIDYNPLPSGGSNFGPTSAALKKAVDERREKWIKAHNRQDIPAELLFASGSGLDPHLSLPAAYFQIARVAKARNLDEERVKELIDNLAIRRRFGFLGEECVNVLLLNIALDG